MKTNTILNGDCLTELKTLPDESINCVMTSPPYWALRDYGVEGQLGLEPTFEEYINKLCDIFDEVQRVLRKDGTCWVNLGDTYSNKDSGGDNVMGNPEFARPHREKVKRPSKCLTMIPQRFAIEMVNRGWILRNTIIWYKPNCMPSSAKDRFTVDFEYIFFFVKNKKYWFETQYEQNQEVSIKRAKYGLNQTDHKGKAVNVQDLDKMGDRFVNPQGRNKRTVWTINPKPFKEAHFAVYPEELCETPIKSGCPEFVCVKCGKPREKIIEHKASIPQRVGGNANWHKNEYGRAGGFYDAEDKVIGLTTCNCKAEFIGGIVLDPFFGAGTTGLVALKQNKQFIGIELNKEYIQIAKARIKPYLEQEKLK